VITTSTYFFLKGYNFSISNKLLIYGGSLYLKEKLLTLKEKCFGKSYPVSRKSTKKNGAVKLN
jgi:hypothetical protein